MQHNCSAEATGTARVFPGLILVAGRNRKRGWNEHEPAASLDNLNIARDHKKQNRESPDPDTLRWFRFLICKRKGSLQVSSVVVL